MMAPRLVFTLDLSPDIQIYFHQHIRKGSATFIPNYSAPHWRSLALDQNTVVLKSHSDRSYKGQPDRPHEGNCPPHTRLCAQQYVAVF